MSFVLRDSSKYPLKRPARVEQIGEGGGEGGGGGVTFPMAEGVWYDQSFGLPCVPDNTDITNNEIRGTLLLIPTACTISKIGIRPTGLPNDPATVLVGIWALDANNEPAAQVGSTATITVPGDWEAPDIPEAATNIAIDAGWYYIGAASNEDVPVESINTTGGGSGLLGIGADGGPRYIGWDVDEPTASVALPATLVGATLELKSGGPQILFQITHD